MVEVQAWHIAAWMLACLLSGAAMGIAYAVHTKRPLRRVWSVGADLSSTHIGTIRVSLVLGWRFRLRMAVALLLFRMGAAVAPARIDVEQDGPD